MLTCIEINLFFENEKLIYVVKTLYKFAYILIKISVL